MTTRDTRLPNVGSSTSISKIIPVRISLRIRRYTRSFLIQKDNRRPGFWLDLNIWSLSSKWLTNSNPANKSRIRGTYSSTLILLAYELCRKREGRRESRRRKETTATTDQQKLQQEIGRPVRSTDVHNMHKALAVDRSGRPQKEIGRPSGRPTESA